MNRDDIDHKNYTLISPETPLISNLSMIENIALIKEVHEFLSTQKAEKIAFEELKRLSLEEIAEKRLIACSPNEILYVMIIRALMMPQKSILLQTPYAIVNNLGDIKTILSNITQLEHIKDIMIIDVITNAHYYEGVTCSIVK